MKRGDDELNTAKLQSAISAFVKNKKVNAAYYDDNWTERKERKAYYQSFTKDKLLAMTEDDFFEYKSRLYRAKTHCRKNLKNFNPCVKD